MAAAVLLVALVATLGVVDAVHPGPPRSTLAITTRHPPAARGPAATPTSPPGPVQPSTTAPATVPPAPSTDGPQLSSVTPASGTAGEAVTIVGAGLYSPDGQVSVTFGGQTASIQCPTQSQCIATVPTLTDASAVPVTVTTAQGASNPLTFAYQAGPPSPSPTVTAPAAAPDHQRRSGHGGG